MKWFAKRNPPGRVRRLQKQVAELQSKLDAAARTIKVLEAERDAMAEVIARDRMRVAAEMAIAARSKAEAEGGEGGRTDESLRRFTA
jgi:hypothetical protein